MTLFGAERYGFLFGLALIWIVFAVVQDLRKREVANWLNFSLVAFGLAYRFVYSSYFSEWMFFVYGMMGFVLFYLIANIFYYSRIFAGGDAKLLMGIGVILPFESFSSLFVVGGGFIVLLFAAGAVYSLVYSLFLVGKHRSKFLAEFKKNFSRGENLLFAIFIALLFVVFTYFVIGFDFWMLLASVLLAALCFISIVYAKSLDVCMIKLTRAGDLTE
jgi:Flp pilus assembly protein protease CpaA